MADHPQASSITPAPDLAHRRAAGLTAFPGGPIIGDIEVPGDKSISHRALILGALAEGVTSISGLLESEDVRQTLDAVRAFGAEARQVGGTWSIEGGPWHSPERIVDCGNSGTSARLLMGAAAAFPLRVLLTGDASLRARPMQRVVDPLRQMGAITDGTFFLPITLSGGKLRGIRYANVLHSAQVKSAILLAGLGTDEPVEVVELIPTRDHSEVMLKAFGCDISVDGKAKRRIRLGPNRKLRACPIQIPGDPSSAAFPIVAALLSPGSELRVRGLIDSPARSGLWTTLIEMGADLSFANRREQGGFPIVDVIARHSRLRASRVPASRAPSMIDEYPILSIAAAHAEGESVMEGLSELRSKESDRLAAMLGGLAACGVEARIEGDHLRIAGSGSLPRGGATIAANSDHRIAMAFLVMGLSARQPVCVDGVGTIATSFPGFASLMASLGARIEPSPGPPQPPICESGAVET